MKDFMFKASRLIDEDDNNVYLMRQAESTYVEYVRKYKYGGRIFAVSFSDLADNQVFVGIHEELAEKLINDLKKALEQDDD